MALIVGAEADPHVRAVVNEMGTPAVVVDAATLTDARVTLTADAVKIRGHQFGSGRGWIRRMAPEGWAESLSGAGLVAAERTAAVSTLAAIARNEQVEWLTQLDGFGAAENKPLQYRRAAKAAIPVPEWVVTTDIARLPTAGEWVSKPLGRGSFIDDDGTGWIVPSTVVDPSEHRDALVRVPFILQRRIRATTHARVVTVGSAVHSATLPASELPLDWRLDGAGHAGFTPTAAPTAVRDLAAKAAAAVGVGYSAQDWICDQDGGWWFIDLNPAGQWLFLPTEVAVPITAAIAAFLDGSQGPASEEGS